MLGLILAALAATQLAAQNAGAELVVQTGHSSSVRSIAFTPDGKVLASLGLDNTIKIWDVSTGKELRSIGESEASASIGLSPDGKTLATVSFKTRSIMLFSIETGELIRRFPPVADVIIWELRFSPDGETIATLGYYNQVRFFNVRSGEQIRAWHLGGRFGAFAALAFSPDGRYLAAPDERGLVVFEVFGKDGFALPVTAETVGALAFSPDGRSLMSGDSNGDIHIFDVAARALISTLPRRGAVGIESLAFSSDGKTLASGAADGSVTLWDLSSTSQQPRTIPAHAKSVFALAFSPDGRLIASGGGDDTIRFWDARSAEPVGRLSPIASLVFSAEFSSDGRYLAMSRENNIVQLWNVETGNELRTLTGHSGLVWRTAFSPGGKILASASADGTIRVWDVETGLSKRELRGHPGEVRRLAFSPDGNILASGDSKGWIIVWNITTGEKREMREPADSHEINALAFNHDGSILASGGWSTIKLWDPNTLEPIRDAGPVYSMVNAIAFSRDGKRVAMASNKQSDPAPADSNDVDEGTRIRIMSVDTLHELGSHSLNDAVYRLQFEKEFPDGFDEFYFETASSAMLAKIVLGSRIRIVSRADRKELASLITTDDGRWTVVAPDGRFDTNNSLDDINGLHWVDRSDPFTPIPLEIFMRQYYEPGLFERLARCRLNGKCASEFRSLPSIVDLNRVQPKLGPPQVSARRPDGTVDVSIAVEPVAKKGVRSGAFDLRLFVDRQLVASSVPRVSAEKYIADVSGGSASEIEIWRQTHDLAPHLATRDGKTSYVFRNIHLPRHGENKVELAAYAFNTDRVKSETVRATVDNVGAAARGRTVLITIGVNASESSKYRLDFAANDAHRMSEILGTRLTASGHDLVRVNLVSDYDAGGRLAENHATKKVIKGVFEILAGRRNGVEAETLRTIDRIAKVEELRPDDTLIISFSGHGYTRDGVFYMLPYDIGENTVGITRATLPRLISSDELSLWMREIVAKEIMFIVDACHSAASVEGAGFKPGPMGSRGLGQLAYDKGMRVLAAAQSNNVALEVRSLRHGLLSYALLEEGIVRGFADTREPKDGMLTAAEWLGYAVRGVPELYKKLIAGRSKVAIGGEIVDLTKLNEKEKAETFCQGNNCKSKASVQQPVLFDFARGRANGAPLFRIDERTTAAR